MIPQDSQVLAMAKLALTKATNSQVKALAPQVKKAVVPEVARMSGWFSSLGSPVPGSAGYHDMSSMPGMSSHTEGTTTPAQMASLAKAKGPAFDRLWLQMMLNNRKGAVAMAKTELSKGGSPDVKQVAQSVLDRETAKIAEMTSILAKVTG
jgi:uncharacterized protein (DUF305 family)